MYQKDNVNQHRSAEVYIPKDILEILENSGGIKDISFAALDKTITDIGVICYCDEWQQILDVKQYNRTEKLYYWCIMCLIITSFSICW